MRHILHTLILLFALPLASLAQKDLNIGKILDGRYRKNPSVTDVEIQGERLHEYQLSYYHSLTVRDDSKIMDAMKAAFIADESKAKDKELTTVGGKLFTGLYRLETDDEENRFVFFKDMRLAPEDKKNAMMIIYMEGTVSLKTLQSKFKK